MTNDETLFALQQALDNATTQLHHAQQILNSLNPEQLSTAVKQRSATVADATLEQGLQIIEGVFNGQNMVGPDGKIYTIPANYVSKSKLVEGDLLKLTIQSDGSFIYKQIGPVERQRLVGTLTRHPETGDFTVVVGSRGYRVIKAAITYYKGEPGDEVVILTPLDGNSIWAAVENVIRDVGSSNFDDLFDPLKGAATLLPDGAEAELPDGNTMELPSGEAAELPSGDVMELPSGANAELKG